MELLRAGQAGHGARREALQREIEVNITEQARLVEAIAGGSEIAVLTKALKTREQRRTYLQHELDTVDAGEHLTAFDAAATARELRRRVKDVIVTEGMASPTGTDPFLKLTGSALRVA